MENIGIIFLVKTPSIPNLCMANAAANFVVTD